MQFEGLRVLGNPAEFAKKYADDGADELIYIDTVASLYGRNNLEEIVDRTAQAVFIPLTVGGGIKSEVDAKRLFDSGADKIAINTEAIRSPDTIDKLSARYGRQAVSVSVDAKRVNGGWEAYTSNGRCKSERDAVAWIHEAVRRGAGEILLTSIDMDGTRRGADIELLKAVKVEVPVIYSGGIRLDDVLEVSRYCDGLAIGASLHYGNCTIQQVKDVLRPHREIR